MSDYVVGFLFTHGHRDVALIRKNKPEWQRGRYNGIGGKIELGENPKQAMTREFLEEAGVVINDWEPFITLSFFNGVRVYFFRSVLAHNDYDTARRVKSQTDEDVGWYCITLLGAIPGVNTLPNLKWLVPMAITGAKGGVLEIETEGEGGYSAK